LPWRDLRRRANADSVCFHKLEITLPSNFNHSRYATAAKRGEEVAITGFGRFSVKERPAREGRNPATGAPLKIPASKSLGFKMSKPVSATL
jgi:nucleoid DNA-binding protein